MERQLSLAFYSESFSERILYPWPMGDFDYAMDVAFDTAMNLSRTPRAGGNVRRGPLEYMPGERRLLVGAA